MKDTKGKKGRVIAGSLLIVLLTGAGLYGAGIFEIGRAPYGLGLPKVVAKVGEESIGRDLVYQRMRQHESMRPGGFEDKDLDALKQIAGRVLDQLIQQYLIRQEASRLGITVSEAEVESQYDRTRANFGSAAEFGKKMKEGNTDPEMLRQDIYDLLLMQKVDLVLQEGMAVSEQELEDFFRNNKEHLLKDRVSARHILLNSLEQAEKVLHLIREEGKEFSELAGTYSRDEASRDRGGVLGWFTKDQMLPEFEKTAFAMKPGDISQPVQTEFGYHIIRVDDVKLAVEQTFDDHRENIRGLLKRQKWQAQGQDWIGQLFQQTTVWRAVGL